jgi:hypothetical protein
MIKAEVHDVEERGWEASMPLTADRRLKTGFLSVRLVYSASHEGITV